MRTVDTDHSTAEADSGGDPFAFADASGDCAYLDVGEMDLVLGEEDLPVASDFAAKFAEATQSGVSDTGGRKRRAVKPEGVTGLFVTEEDFEPGEEREAFLLIHNHFQVLFSNNFRAAEKHKAIEFFFCHGDREMSLRDAVGAISASIRIDVVRLRLVYEMWLRKFRLGGPIGFESVVGCPEKVRANAAYLAGDVGGCLVEVAWYQPGITVGEVFERAAEMIDSADVKELPWALDRLIEQHIVSVVVGTHSNDLERFLWVTGRNPVLELEERARGNFQRVREGNFTWSRLF
ncbi:hypothetical protein MBR110_30105 (plasmid) [Burkholderia sp. MBR-1]|nr:hypothetical protein MBR110_30105 [Burkholderia sp. MBR-1]